MFAGLRQLARTYPVSVFLVLAFALSWYPWFIALAQQRQTGPNPLGPFAAALIATALGLGKHGVRALLATLVRARVGWRWLLLTLGTPIAITAAAVLLNTWAGAPAPTAAQWAAWPGRTESFLIILLFVALGEEPGWRGFLLPRLAQRFGVLRGSALLAAVWSLWHLPLLGHAISLPQMLPFLLGVITATFVLTWLYLGTGGSVLLPMLMHATLNTIGAEFTFGWVTGPDLTRLWWISSGLWLLLAIVAAWRLRGATVARD